MPGRREWRVRTRFREIVVRLEGAPTPARPGTAVLLSDILFELQNGSGEARRAIREIVEELGDLPGARPADGVSPDRAARALATAVGMNGLRLDEVRAPEVPDGLALVDPD